jgi:nucleoside-diphosphate-sugar epimerase
MRYLVAGGDGFIGSALTAALVTDGHEVIVADNHSTSQPGPDHTRVTRHHLDIADLDADAFGEIDAIFHLASVAAPALYMERPEAVLRPNLNGTERLCEVAANNRCPLLYASTSEVYGHSAELPGGERGMAEDNRALVGLLTARSVYAAAKRAGEEVVLAHRQKGGTGASVRLFNVYGPGLDLQNPEAGRVIRIFIEAARRGNPFTINGDGNQTRSFLWIDDCIEALRLLVHASDLPPAINVGHPTPTSIIDLARMVADLAGVRPRFAHVPPRPDEPRHRFPSLDLITSLTGWAPRTELREGLDRILRTIRVQAH